MQKFPFTLRLALFCTTALFCPALLRAAAGGQTWHSAVTGAEIAVEALQVDEIQLPPGQRFPSLIIYLKNLACDRVGQEPDESILADFKKDGYRVVMLDYAKHPQAKSPELNLDIDKIRQDLKGGLLPTLGPIDVSHAYILAEGCRLARDVPFFVDGPTSLTMRMDIGYPSKPAKPVPVIMEFSCDNLRRMGNSSMAGITDTILEGAPAAGMAWAMCDHPVAKSYHGMDPMPDTIHKARAAVRALRAEGKKLGLNGKIGVYGFSRGAGVAAMVADPGGGHDDVTALDFSQNMDAPMRRLVARAEDIARQELEIGGLCPDESSAVQAVLVGSGRFDYTDMPDSPDLARYEDAWGPLATNHDAWAAQGAMTYIGHKSAPIFIHQYQDDMPLYVTQAAKLDKRLSSLAVKHIYVASTAPRGHHLPNDTRTLSDIYDFFSGYLNPGPSSIRPRVGKPQ